ncbi:MAG TPA: DMT family transporter [Xanthobacteraceae bacterium]|nr:DMT family transporter [Xanthobacteraceae bacterium]
MNVFLGIALQLGATFSFTVMGAFVRYIGERVPLGEQVFARSFFALIPLIAMLQWRGELASAVRTNNPFGHLRRGLTGVFAMVCMFAALARLPLVDATAIGFATPLINVALAAIFLGEKVHIFRWSAVAVGLVGVIVMLSPHLFGAERQESSAIGALLAVSGAFLTAAAMTQVRHMSATETTASLVFSFSLISTVASLATLPWGWIKPAPMDSLVLFLTGIVGGIAQIMITESYRHASAGTVAPFSYTAMLWSIALGFLFFGEIPEPVVLAGALLVIAAGLFVIFRERRLGIDRTLEREAETPPAGPAV